MPTKYTIEFYKQLAISRGGACLSDTYININTNLTWKCHNPEHPPWEAKPNDVKNKNSWCPYCSNKKVINSNSLATVRPDIAAEWHPTKNGELTPDDVVFGSGEKVWWQCSINSQHEWKCPIVERTTYNRGCGQCWLSSKTSFPEQAIYFYLKKIFPKTENKYKHPLLPATQEIDNFIHEIEYSIEYDGYQHGKSKVIKVDEEKNNIFSTKKKKLIRVRDSNLPKINFYDCHVLEHFYSDNRYYTSLDEAIRSILNYILKDLHDELPITIQKKIKEIKIDSFSDKLEITALYRNSIIKNNLKSRYPELAEELNPDLNSNLKPENLSYGSNIIITWQCRNNPLHLWPASIKDRAINGNKCPTCNSISHIHPELMKFWNFEKNKDVSPELLPFGSNQVVWWKFEDCNHEFPKSINNFVNHPKCSVCNGRYVCEQNRLDMLYPNVAKDWNYEKNGELLPSQFAINSTVVVNWICERGHEKPQKIKDRINGVGCEKCHYMYKDFETSLGYLFPHLEKEWDYETNTWDIFEINPNTTLIKPNWKCLSCGRNFEMTPFDRTKRGRSCGCNKN